MKIVKVNQEKILFDNGNKITFDHVQDCCENNYADFKQICSLARKTDFDEDLVFESVEGAGFRFGNKRGHMFFVPCYSEQNGYYTAEIDIYYKDKRVVHINECDQKYIY
jgi:hypothetical protein